MAVSMKGWRRIVVDGVLYFWRFPPRQDYAQAYALAVHEVMVRREHLREAGLRLFVSRRDPESGVELNTPLGPVLPSDVARGVREALAAGWRADVPGRKFVHSIYKPPEVQAGSEPHPSAAAGTISTSTALIVAPTKALTVR